MPSGVRGDGLGRALRRRITLLYADCSGCPAPSRMTVLRRESPLSRIANPGRLPCRIAAMERPVVKAPCVDGCGFSNRQCLQELEATDLAGRFDDESLCYTRIAP